MSQERRERTRRIRKQLHEALPGCIAVVDHGDFVGAYLYPEDLAEAKKVIEGGEWEGVSVHARPIPPLSSR